MQITNLDKLRWKLYKLKRRIILTYGFKTGLIHPYDKETIGNLSNIYLGGIPASLIILSHTMCVRRCYDRAFLVTYGFGDDDFKLVDADIDSIKYHPGVIERETGKDPHYANHCFAERTRKDGSVWVYDTTEGLVFEKSLYYKLENPKITKVNDKKTCELFADEICHVSRNINKDKDAVPLLLPMIEEMLKKAPELYEEAIKEEIANFKEKIGYDELCREQEEEKRAHFARMRGA